MKSVEAINWTVKDLTTTYYGGIRSPDPKLLVLPTYQRSFVWSLVQRYNLVDSLKRGWPVGALIVRATGETKAVTNDGSVEQVSTYELIDGQQRSTSLILHSLFPLGILEVEGSIEREPEDGPNFLDQALDFANLQCDMVQSRIGNLLGHDLGENWFKDKLRKQLTECYEKKTFISKDGANTAFTVRVLEKEKLDYVRFRNALCRNLSLDVSRFGEVIPAGSTDESNFVRFLSNIQKILNIDDEVIPVISWSGKREDAPSVFVRVNQGGVKLKKEQVLAASFAHSVTDIDYGRVQALAEKVLKPEVGKGLLEQIPNDSEDLHIDLYAALIGLSELLVEEHPEFFKRKPSPAIKKNDDGDGEGELEITAGNHARVEHYYAFNIVTLMMQLPLSLQGMQKLDNEIKTQVGEDNEERISFSKVVEAVLAGTNLVCKKLDVFAKSTSNNPNVYEAAHTELGFAALIARYAIEFLQGRRPTGDSIIGHYINDSIKGINEGNAHNDDYAAFTRVWSTTPNIEGQEKQRFKLNPRYLAMIPTDELEITLDDYWNNAKKDAETKPSKRSVDKDQKMILKLYARSSISHARYIAIDNFEIDHSIPFAWIKSWESKQPISYYGAGLIGNLAVLPQKVNSKKRDRTLDQYEDSGDRQRDFPRDNLFELVPYKQGDLNQRGWTATQSPSLEDYLEFVESNWSVIRANVLEAASDLTVRG